MTAFHGKKGIVDFTGLTLATEVTSFTIDTKCEIAECTVMNSLTVTSATHWKNYLVGFKDWSATVETILPSGGIGIDAVGTEAALGLDTTDGYDWAGTAICTGLSITNSADDVGRVTLSFEGVAAITASA